MVGVDSTNNLHLEFARKGQGIPVPSVLCTTYLRATQFSEVVRCNLHPTVGGVGQDVPQGMGWLFITPHMVLWLGC